MENSLTSLLPDGRWLSPTVFNAVEFMVKSHGDQTRKGGSPYWIHPLRVWQSIRSVLDIQDDVIECAALCHDVVEDTPVSINDIETLFGTEVSMVVNDLTNNKDLPKRDRKDWMIVKSLNIDNRARIIKCFDRIDNLMDGVSVFSPEGIWNYTKEAILLHRNLRDGLKNDDWTEKARKAIKLLEKAIDNVASYCHNAKYKNLPDAIS